MSDAFLTLLSIYTVWFFLFILVRGLLFSGSTRITPNMQNLSGLRINNVNILRNNNPNPLLLTEINNDFQLFISKTGVNKNNYIIRLLREMYLNNRLGRRTDADYYLQKLRRISKKPVFTAFLTLWIPPIIVLYLMVWENSVFFSGLNMEETLPYVILFQILGFMAVIIFARYTDSRCHVFSDFLYFYWYDRIGNLDYIIANEMKEQFYKLTNSDNTNLLLASVNTLESSVGLFNEKMESCIGEFTNSINKFTEMRLNTEDVTWEKIAETLNTTSNQFSDILLANMEFYNNFNLMSGKMEEIIAKTSTDSNAIIDHSKKLSELHKLLSEYKNDIQAESIETLRHITEVLSGQIIKTFEKIQNTFTVNEIELQKKFEDFWLVCNNFCEMLDKRYDEDIIKTMNEISTEIKKSLEKLNKENSHVEMAISRTVYSVESISKSIYDYNQFLLSPGVIKKLRNFNTLNKKLNDLNARVTSYQMLEKLYENNKKDTEESIEDKEEITV